MTKTVRWGTGICLALLFAACSYENNSSSGAGGSGKTGGTTGSSTGGTTSNSSGGTTSNSSGGTTSNSTGGTTGNATGGTTSNSSGGTTSNSTGGTAGSSTGGATGGTSGSPKGGATGSRTGGTTGSPKGGTTGTLTGGTTTTPTGGSTTGQGGTTGGDGGTSAGGTTGSATGGKSGGASGQGGSTGSGGQTGGAGGGGGVVSGCVPTKEWATANPAAAGPFKVAADKKVGPLAGALPDPVYGDEQQHFNVYRPENLKDSGYCHPVVVWANGYKDNPEENPPKCIINRNDQWCGQYSPMLNHLASHGFVVIASLSTTTGTAGSDGLLPTIAGLNWLLEQAEDSTSQYYHRLDTTQIGALGHSMGGMSTCKSASEPRYKALAAICGTSTLSGVHTPMLFYCGGKDTTVKCDGVKSVFATVTNQPAFFIDEFNSDHGWWVYQGASGVSLSMAAAWFRVHLMNDTANRKYFYGSGCTFCKDSRVEVAQNSLMLQ
jgi:hypothetical protein